MMHEGREPARSLPVFSLYAQAQAHFDLAATGGANTALSWPGARR